MAGDIGEVGAEFASITDRDFDHAALRMRHFESLGQRLPDERFDLVVAAPAWIEIDEHGRKRGMQIANSRPRSGQRVHQPENLLVRFERNRVAKRDKERRVARRADGHGTVILPSAVPLSRTESEIR
jgi:hypothetical protein